jgi:hypothetical protein
MADKKWHTYEEVAQYLLNQFAAYLGLERVEEKQKVLGQLSGRQIEIDGRGVREGNTGFVILECKRYKDRVEAEKLEALAFRITDAGASGGIVVSPLGLQEGAAKIAATQNIVTAQLNRDANEHQYILRFLQNVMIGVQDTIKFKDSATVEKVSKKSPTRVVLELEDRIELDRDQ